MASPGLFLLLMTCYHLVFTVSQSPAEKHLQKAKAAFKAVRDHLDFIDHLDEFRQSITPLLGLIEHSGPAISAVVNLILFIIIGTTKEDKVLKTLVNEFQSLNFKLDQYHVEQRWDSWASGVYHKPEMDIEVAWTTYFTFVSSLAESTDEETKQRHLDEFLTSYQKYEPATKILHKLLMAKETTFINNLGEMLAEHVTCHQNSIREYAVFLDTLFFKGTMLNQIYYHLKNISSQARIDEAAQIQHDFQTAMVQLHKHCILQIKDYVEKDVEGVPEEKDRNKLAKKIRLDLEKNHESYEWMVVAFKTKNSERFKIQNKHTLTGFTVIKKGEVSVAVARQTKGKHNMAGTVKEAIGQCIEKLPLCYKVEKKLKKCNKPVGDVLLSKTYTAVHAFHGNPHESHTESEISTENGNSYIHTGECQTFALFSKTPFKGKYHVMIKSDEEIKNDTCSNLHCGDKGRCDSVGSPPVAMCECNYPYYGKNCEKTLEDFKKSLNIENFSNSAF